MRRLASCGRPCPGCTSSCSTANNRPVPDGEPGEICVRGPLVMDGYRDNPELTAEAFAGGWLHTGDVAVRDPGGFLRIIDRTKDMIVSGGFNIYPREIEDIIGQHPAVSQVAVIGVPHPKWGEAVKALVVLRPGQTATAEELIAMVAERKGVVPGAEDRRVHRLHSADGRRQAGQEGIAGEDTKDEMAADFVGRPAVGKRDFVRRADIRQQVRSFFFSLLAEGLLVEDLPAVRPACRRPSFLL